MITDECFEQTLAVIKHVSGFLDQYIYYKEHDNVPVCFDLMARSEAVYLQHVQPVALQLQHTRPKPVDVLALYCNIVDLEKRMSKVFGYSDDLTGLRYGSNIIEFRPSDT